jgi:hypothetical protein
MKMVPFLLVAIVVMALALGVGGAWLMPMLGIEGALARAIPAGIAGAIIAILYVKMVKRPDSA